MKKIILKGFVLLLVAGAIYGAWRWIESRRDDAGAPGGPPRGGGPAPVTVYTVVPRTFSSRIESVGTVRSQESIDVSANVTETVEELLFDDGAVVTNGQLLAILSFAEEKAGLAAAEANLAEHKREAERLKDLVAQGAVPQVRLQTRVTLAEVAEQRIQEMRAQIQDRRITAPFAGMLGLRQISRGALVTPGKVITTLDKIDRVKLDFTVPEVFMAELRPGLRITARSPAYPNAPFVGEVAFIDSRIDPVSRAVTVRALFDNPDFRLRPGMLMTTTLEGKPRESPGIPERAVLSSAQNHFAFVIQGEGDSLTVDRRRLELGRRVTGYVEVMTGAALGERVAADGLLGLRNGSPVNIIGTFQGPVEPFQPEEGQSSATSETDTAP